MVIGGVAAAQSALMAESNRLQASAHNRANLLTDGYKALRVSNSEAATPGAGVETFVQRDESPGPPLVDAAGSVLAEASNVDLVDEAVTRITAQRAYEANLISLQTQADMTDVLLDQLI
jgi:flagellar basal body rod protein FlgG